MVEQTRTDLRVRSKQYPAATRSGTDNSSSGDVESDEYARQANAMEAVWHALGYPSEHVKLPGHNHFTMAHQLREPDSVLTQALLRQMKLEGGQ